MEPDDEFPTLPKIAGYDPLGSELADTVLSNVLGVRPRPISRKTRHAANESQDWSGPAPDARDPQLLGAALDDLVGRRRWRREIAVRRVLESWELVVGVTNAAHSRPEGYVDKVLRVRTDSTAWATVLRRMAPRIIAMLNERIGQETVKRLEIKGPDAPNWKHGRLSIADGRGPRDTYG
ncbi:hypothetical protein HMPREF1531_00893 [Propionibacterium sp. oral taxon 192 str. F0372]|uniref:DUF721 domain-containing protein n=1 Tax=Propionibacterium sp. oral taxon 192 TaxID=671222 RepID=UPI000353124B|nr:DciA family protein [Propionibacterium sp. oral taxon 192]EPH06244.1 hypothetical protein HMPREF1531_00893 [Propionibacterium sp. oral taxon 192 str. F0372]